MKKTRNNPKSNKFVFFIWEDVVNISIVGLIVPCLLVPFVGQECSLWGFYAVVFLSFFSLRTAIFDEAGVTIKMHLLPIKRKLLYDGIVSIEYKSPKGPDSILIKDIDYVWWKCLFYRIYLPAKYEISRKKLFFFLRFIKKHSSVTITPIGMSNVNDRLCKKINAYY